MADPARGERPMKMMFLRDFGGLTGGHLKYFDFLRHTATLGGIEPELFLTPTSSTDASNPFLSAGVPIVRELKPSDSYFLAGMDWGLLDAGGIVEELIASQGPS